MFGYVLVKIMVIIGCIAIIFLLSIETGIQIQFENWEKKKSNMGVCVFSMLYMPIHLGILPNTLNSLYYYYQSVHEYVNEISWSGS